jgi:hypothetical protein
MKKIILFLICLFFVSTIIPGCADELITPNPKDPQDQPKDGSGEEQD